MTEVKRKRVILLVLLTNLIFIPVVYGLDSVAIGEEALYFSAYEEELHSIGYRIYRLDTATGELEKTAYTGGIATLYDAPRKLKIKDGNLYFLDGRKNPNSPHQGMLLRYDPDENSVRAVSAYEADDYALTEDGIWIIYGGHLAEVKSVSMIALNLYEGRALRRLESSGAGLYLLEDLPDGDSMLSFFNPDTGKSIELVRGDIGNFTIHEDKLYLYYSESGEMMEIGLHPEGYGDDPVMVLQGAGSIPKFDDYGYLYFIGREGNLWAYVRSSGILLKMTDGPVRDWQPLADYLYVARESELPFHFLVDMKTGNKIPVTDLNGEDPD